MDTQEYFYASDFGIKLGYQVCNASKLIVKDFMKPTLELLIVKFLHPDMDEWESKELNKLIMETLPGQYKALEHSELYKELAKCNNKTALVLPANLAYPYGYVLKTFKSFQDMMKIGNESYFGEEYQFHLSGVVPGRVVKKLFLSKENGIMESWTGIIVSRILGAQIQKGRVEFKGFGEEGDEDVVSMKGNIVVTFYVLLLGLCISILVSVFEFMIY